MSLQDKLAAIPESPGCYLMKNASGDVIYVGKAKVLRSRVRSYFQKGADLTRRIRRMVYEVRDLDWIATDSELEALILESNLIKKHRPTYNVRLRDDKSYPYIAVTMSEEWPGIVYIRKLRMQPKEKDKYFGPYTDSEAVRETMRVIRRVFRVPCGWKHPEQSRGKACMYYHIGQCTGVCVGKITKEEYMRVINDVMDFLEGRTDPLVKRLLKQMENAAENLEFEKAARIRDQIRSIQTLAARQKVVSTTLEDQDVIAIATENGNTVAEMFFVRGGKLVGQEHFMLENAAADELGESLREFVQQYYDTAAYVPPLILLSEEVGETEILETWLRQKRGSKVTVACPKRGEKKRLVEMARKNAELFLNQVKLKMAKDEQVRLEQLYELKEAIGCPTLPHRIEAYDVSNIQGQYTVASLVVFEDGEPKKAHYRKFRIRSAEGAPDDYASMKEALSRRLTGKLRQTEAFAELPDLMIIDGGKGQLNAALEAIRESEVLAKHWEGDSLTPPSNGKAPAETLELTQNELRIPEMTIIGLAKRNEEIFKPGESEPILLERNSKALHLIQRIRDEAHRFAITYHRTERGKAMKTSLLNEIPGIGPKRRRALIRHFGSVEAIRDATVEEIMAVRGMTKASAEAVYKFFRQTPS
ncbi:MAG: excinuclease ABC subunit UvrC [Armatimonadetes bacterium]|nr:excinuclease ABC subunit UvrC [Armatimonadota bacterium]